MHQCLLKRSSRALNVINVKLKYSIGVLRDIFVCDYRDWLKCLFQVFAVVCFVCAVCVLSGVARWRGARCAREPVPWSWLRAQDLIDLLLRIEYVADVPM
ncbi:unnamed protein product [Parnassius apollo]|uniref:(apollo) hypothetical protein n=1 Tax=Parnassius apollo TaxID=110799 RepID=A0A8S3XX98_PARAO|nr:unnamed protein product [Parnassius apollo]